MLPVPVCAGPAQEPPSTFPAYPGCLSPEESSAGLPLNGPDGSRTLSGSAPGHRRPSVCNPFPCIKFPGDAVLRGILLFPAVATCSSSVLRKTQSSLRHEQEVPRPPCRRLLHRASFSGVFSPKGTLRSPKERPGQKKRREAATPHSASHKAAVTAS